MVPKSGVPTFIETQIFGIVAKLNENTPRGGGGFFHNKGTWGCAARKGMLFQPSSLAKGILFANFRPFSLGKGILFGNFGQRNVKLR